MKSSIRALGRLKVGAKNGTEAAYEEQVLKPEMQAGFIAWYRFEGLKLRLADNTFYTPDYAVMLVNGLIQCREVKGFWTDDARVKIKVAADQYPFEFMAVTKLTKKLGGGWKEERF